ncbi:MAG: leucyl aminopeptidase family protein [Beijerinckiaceae bacterium]
MSEAFARSVRGARPIWFVTKASWSAGAPDIPPRARAFTEASGFTGASGQITICPDDEGLPAVAIMGLGDDNGRRRDAFLPGKLASALPPGAWRFANAPGDDPRASELAALAFALATYSFRRYRKPADIKAKLALPGGVDGARLSRIVDAVAFARDLINTPANDMGPEALEAAALSTAKRYKARTKIIRGDDLLKKNFPLIHAVGRAAAEKPRLVDITWGPEKGRKITLIGKGVCFDTGGLDIKPSSAMLLMKKDMAGAAVALALGRMIMDAGLKVRLRILLPIVENSVSAPSFRPGDVYPSRKGLTVEIGNTDAEGRLILADALALADEEHPELMINFATLTGAARVALGPDLPPFYCTSDEIADEMLKAGFDAADPVWRMPLWDPYDALLDGKISDINNVSSGPFAGSITAALFLRRFVDKAAQGKSAWAHFDIYGWNPSTKPGRPEGGEAQTARMLYDLIEKRFG